MDDTLDFSCRGFPLLIRAVDEVLQNQRGDLLDYFGSFHEVIGVRIRVLEK